MTIQKVKFPCEHGKWFRHPTNLRSPGPFTWCDGGPVKLLVFWRSAAPGAVRTVTIMLWGYGRRSLMSNTTTLTVIDPDDIRWAIRSHAPLMSDRMLDKIMQSIGGRERTFRQKVAWLPTKVYEAFRVHNQMGEWCDDVESKEVWVEVTDE